MIFKKQLSILIAFLVLVSNSGLAFNIHFCEGKIDSVTSVFSDSEACAIPIEDEITCCAKLEPSHSSCCSNKKVTLDNKVEKITFKIVVFELDSMLHFNVLKPIQFLNRTSDSVLQYAGYYCNNYAPPLYLLYSQYTFYC